MSFLDGFSFLNWLSGSSGKKVSLRFVLKVSKNGFEGGTGTRCAHSTPATPAGNTRSPLPIYFTCSCLLECLRCDKGKGIEEGIYRWISDMLCLRWCGV